MRYVDARVKKEYRDETYRIYVSETLRLLSPMKGLKMSYNDIVNKKPKEKDTRTGKEVAEAAAQKMGIKINWGGES